MLAELAAIAKALNKRGSGTVKDLISAATPGETHKAVAAALSGGRAPRRPSCSGPWPPPTRTTV